MNYFNFDRFINAYSSHITNMIHANPSFQPFLVTKTFANPDAYLMEKVAKFIWRQNERIHFHIQSRLTKNYSRKPHLFARSFDFLDIGNTKQSFRVNTNAPLKPHLHSIYLVHTETLSAFNHLIKEGFLPVIKYRMRSPEQYEKYKIIAFPRLMTIDAQPIRIGEIPETLSYAAKLLKNYSIQGKMADIDFYDALPRTEKTNYLPAMSSRQFLKTDAVR